MYATHLFPIFRRVCDVKLCQHQPYVLAIVLPYPAQDHQVTILLQCPMLIPCCSCVQNSLNVSHGKVVQEVYLQQILVL